MCLLLFSYRTTPGYYLVMAANRDEFFSRPTAPLAYWDKEKKILAGKDLEAGGTWLGVDISGKVAALTNFREPPRSDLSFRSRGDIVLSYLTGQKSSVSFPALLQERESHYRGFNLLYGDHRTLSYYCNRVGQEKKIGPGIYGLSNRFLDSPWPKVTRGKRLLSEVLAKDNFDIEDIFAILKDVYQPGDRMLPDTGVGLEWERLLAPIYIRGDSYGTRSSAVIFISHEGEITFAERSYSTKGETTLLEKRSMMKS